MAFTPASQKFNAAIKTVEIGSGDKKITLGGECVFPFYTFDAPIENAPKVGVEISDLGIGEMPGIVDFYAGCDTIVEQAKKAATMEGADFVSIRFESADPNGDDTPVDKCVEIAKAVADAIDLPLVICGCKNAEKDGDLFNKMGEVLQGKNVAFLACKEENYKKVGMSAGLAYGHKVGAESAVDINLAKQLNVELTQLGLKNENIVMNVGTATAGYGFEYVVSTMDRIKAAALSQNDAALQMPIITPVASETYGVKESVVAEADAEEGWGPVEDRAIDMEVVTAMACLASGSNAVILRHPVSVAKVSELIKELI